MKKIMLAGEPMGLLIAREEGPLDRVRGFDAAVAGAELNVAVGLSRLGHETGYLTKLGRDPFGGRVRRTLEENGISTALAAESAERPTGFMLKSKVREGDPEIYYYRKGSAAATICPDDVDAVDFSGYGALHLTGIFPALSVQTRAAAQRLLERAKEAGMTVFFDPNLRPQLWPDRETMARTLNGLAARADYFLPGVAEGEVLAGTRDPEKIAAHYRKLGVGTVVVKLGGAGAYAEDDNGGFVSPGYRDITVVDTVGAGDGFAAGVISAVCEGLSLEEAVTRGNAIGAMQVQSVGDNEGLPDRKALEAFMNTHRRQDA